MRALIIIIFIFISNCSLNNNSKYLSEDNNKRIESEKRLNEIKKKSIDITSMSFKEYQLYINDYTNKSKYPDISKWKKTLI